MPDQFDPVSAITTAAQKYDVPPELALGVARRESNLNPNIPDSSAGAMGLMQIRQPVAAQFGGDPRDPAQNADMGVRYLAQQYHAFNRDPELAAAAYNAGPGNAQRFGKNWSAYSTAHGSDVGAYVSAATADLGPSDSAVASAYGQGAPAANTTTAAPASNAAAEPSDDDIAKAFPGVGTPTPPAPKPNPPGTIWETANEAQKATALQRQAQHLYDPTAPRGSDLNFFAQQEGIPIPQGAAFVDLQGKFHPQEAPITAQGVSQAFGSGLANTAFTGMNLENPASVIGQGFDIGSALAGWGARQAGIINPAQQSQIANSALAFRQGIFGSTPTEQQAAAGLYHAPANIAERGAFTAGAALPFLPAGPAAVTRSALGGFGASEGARALGLGPEAQTLAGLAGGVAAGVPLRGATPQAELPPETAPISSRAATYLSGRLSTPDPEMIAAAQAGKPVTTAEMLGPQGRLALKATATRPGATGARLNTEMSNRGDNLPNDIANEYIQASGVQPDQARATIEDQIEANKANIIRPGYKSVLDQPVMRTKELQSVLEEPEVAPLVSAAKRLVGNQNATEAAIKIDPDTGNAVLDPHTQQPVMEAQPSAQVLDLTKKLLGMKIARDPFTREPVNSGDAAVTNVMVQNHLRNLTDALAGNDEKNIAPAIPGYRQLLDQTGDNLSLSDAFRKGTALFNDQVKAQDYGAQHAAGSPAEQQSFRLGQANAIFDRQQKGQLSPTLFEKPIVQAKLRAVLGDDATNDLLTGVGHLKAMNANGGWMKALTGSPTTPLSKEIEAQDTAHPIRRIAGEMTADALTGAAMGHGDIAHRAALGAAFAGGRQALKGTQYVGKMVSETQMPQDVRDEVGRILMSNLSPDQLKTLISRAGGRSTSTANKIPLSRLAIPAALPNAPASAFVGAGNQ